MGEKEKSGRSHRQQEIPPAEEKPTNGTIYDDVFRTMIDKIPHLIIPLINEVFSRQYPDSEPVTALQNEHLEITEGKVIMDSYLKIADKYYHVECQSSPDGTVVDYRTPIIKVNQYDFEEIFQKKLLFFLPYYVMRYEAVLPEIEVDKEKLRGFLEEYRRIYQKLEVLRSQHRLSDYDFMELKQLIETIINHLAYGKERIRKGVHDMGGKVLEFEHDILMRESEARGVLKGEKIGELRGVEIGEKRGDARTLVKNVESIMRTLDLSLEKACEAMETTVEDDTKAKHMILGKKK